ncbi:adenine-specific DNA methylase containing a Zn-ribbon [Halanaeroarchaeum sulfurireducens]|uniref:Adenine-specific DNA methylase containing a Zn-ribbon n=1 Tax=Halanaeroarchaeum sulfurireducens TaxID=1604004 RepID=A0A0N9NA51_9EURY|nr:adenine-specific DNA methylase containing a Zn-ribbon [Halanaeroarchaeum sulfurireducens]
MRDKRATTPAVVHCPNRDCDDRIIELDKEIPEQVTCPSCSTTFDPSDGNYGYGKYTCKNGHKHDVKETLQRLDEKPEFEYFAIHYRAPDGKKKFKVPDDDDGERINAIERYYEKNESDLRIPTQSIPEGDKTQALLNYNYDKFSELFTKRHQIAFAKLLENAKNINDQQVSESLITTISSTIEYNSKLCKWSTRNGGYGGHTFERHAYIPRVQPVEGNPLAEEGLASVRNFFENKTLSAKEYCQHPFEKVKNTETGEVKKHLIQGEKVSEDRLLSLKSKTSEKLDEDDETVDYIITDPPYYDNVQYSELSDYFYVWLREVLQDEYEEFEPELVPKAREIVANSSANKGEDFFVESLTNVFSESHRVLKKDGELIFTYHHNENEAWSVILEAIIESGFTVAGAYPVQSEMPNNPHISDLDNAEYDIIIFANKEDTDEDITLEELRQNLYFELQDMIDEERQRHENLSTADLGVILRGKSMYYYSKHYPNVYTDDEQVGIGEVLDTVDAGVEQALENTVDLPKGIDPITQAYAALYQRGNEGYDDLNKHLLAKNLNVSDLEDEKLVKGPRDKKEPMTADERIHFIEGKLNSNGDDGNELLDIDRVQYLYHLYKTDQNTTEYLKEWKSDDLEELAEFMADVSGDERYENVMDMTLQQF